MLPLLSTEMTGHLLQAMQPAVNAVIVPMIKVPIPIHAVCGAIKLPIKPPTAEQRAPVTGPKKIPDNGESADVREKALPVPQIGMVGKICPAATIAAQTAITAG